MPQELHVTLHSRFQCGPEQTGHGDGGCWPFLRTLRFEVSLAQSIDSSFDSSASSRGRTPSGRSFRCFRVISAERRAILRKIALKIHLEEGALSPLVGVVKAPIQVGRAPRIELHQ